MRKAEPPPLSPDDTLRDALRLMLGEGLEHLSAHLPGCRNGEMEAIHQARVALRRLRTVLRLLRPVLAPVPRVAFEDGLRRLARVLGAARDWDMFLFETLPGIARDRPARAGALDGLRVPAGSLRVEAHRALSAVLADPRLRRRLDELADWPLDPEAFANRHAADRILSGEAPRMLDKLARRSARRGAALDRLDDDGRHALRRSLKALRYGTQMLDALWAADRTRSYRNALSALQEDLGRMNDAATAVALSVRLPDQPGRAVIEAWAAGHGRAAIALLPEQWRRFRSIPPFWSRPA